MSMHVDMQQGRGRLRAMVVRIFFNGLAAVSCHLPGS